MVIKSIVLLKTLQHKRYQNQAFSGGRKWKMIFCFLLAAASFMSTGVKAQTADFTINIRNGCVPLGGVNFTDASSGGTVTRRDWDLGNGTLISSGPAVVGTNYLTSQTFIVKLTVTFLNGTVRTKTDSVIVYPKPFVDFRVNDTAGCVPYTASFTDLSTTATGTINTWTWDFGAGGSTIRNPAFVYNSPGLYNISLIVKNNWGCESDAATKFQYVHVWNKPTAAFTANPYFSCNDTATVFFNNSTTNGSPANKYQWDFGDGNSSTLKTRLILCSTGNLYG
ncbi:MAG: PKD domain-containing protein [Chitinophagaceae bacterium]|nr:PKD domain-containing protein [Chitinophagaceae bacterium]